MDKWIGQTIWKVINWLHSSLELFKPAYLGIQSKIRLNDQICSSSTGFKSRLELIWSSSIRRIITDSALLTLINVSCSVATVAVSLSAAEKTPQKKPPSHCDR